MESDALLTEIIQTYPRQWLTNLYLDWIADAGHYLEIEGQTYTVLESHHHYQYKMGGYRLQKITLQVQATQCPSEKSLYQGRWIIGDSRCQFNAHSEILRCAVNPEGPCQDCRFFEKI
ncbi:MAG: DUF6464 family protein [Microcystaceae cyanobacterium]